MMSEEHPNQESPLNILSPREIQVLKELSQGKSNKAIALSLSVTVNTIEKHLTIIYRKLDFQNRAEAILWWIQSGGVFRS
jgi:DNA-binding NarL/FixJ family response regulator